MKDKKREAKTVRALKVRQWVSDWTTVAWNTELMQAKPDREHFYVLSVNAKWLKRLSGIQRRSTKEFLKRADDPGIQRFHDEERSKRIADFIRFGYPWSELSDAKTRVRTVRSTSEARLAANEYSREHSLARYITR